MTEPIKLGDKKDEKAADVKEVDANVQKGKGGGEAGKKEDVLECCNGIPMHVGDSQHCPKCPDRPSGSDTKPHFAVPGR